MSVILVALAKILLPGLLTLLGDQISDAQAVAVDREREKVRRHDLKIASRPRAGRARLIERMRTGDL